MSSHRGRPAGSQGPRRRERPTGLNPTVVAQCSTPECGQPDASEVGAMLGRAPMRVPDGWIFAKVQGSALPGRWFCSPACERYGVAQAQLRMAPTGPTPPK